MFAQAINITKMNRVKMATKLLDVADDPLVEADRAGLFVEIWAGGSGVSRTPVAPTVRLQA